MLRCGQSLEATSGISTWEIGHSTKVCCFAVVPHRLPWSVAAEMPTTTMISDTAMIHHPPFEKAMNSNLSLRTSFCCVLGLFVAVAWGCASTGSQSPSTANGSNGSNAANTTNTANGNGVGQRVADTSNNSNQSNTQVAPPPSHRPTPLEMEEAAASRSPLKGVAAPAFTLQNQDEKPVALESLRGKWTILYFYPKDDTPGCTCQATEFTDILRRFHMLNAQVYGISPDSPSSHRFFITKYKLKLPLLSDTSHKVMANYGSYVPFKVGAIEGHRVVRSTFLIDPNGKIAYHWPEVIPEGHAARVRDKLAAIQKQGAGS